MRRVAIIIDEAHSSQGSDIRCREHALSEVGAEEGDVTFEEQDRPHHGGAEAPSERDLLRLHGHAEEQDARDLPGAVLEWTLASTTVRSVAGGRIEPGLRRFSLKRICSVAVVLTLLTLAPAAEAFLVTWQLTEFQPNVPNGGRANTIAVHPTDSRVMIVASETGGLFRTSDEGITWTHIDSLGPFAMGAVAYVPANPNIVIATANEGFLTQNAGGIWRSTDGGSTWTHIADPPAPAGMTSRFSAGEISIAPDTGKIFIATSYGVSISADSGVTWATSQPFPVGGTSSVLALPRDLVLAGAPSSAGIRRSTDGGATWTAATTPPRGVADMHAFGRSPFDATHAYVVDWTTRLYVTEDAGVTWAAIASAPIGFGSCGGIGFVKAIRTPLLRGSLQLYFGNRCGLWHLSPPRIAGTTRFDYSGAWTPLTLDHGDTRDLAFKRVGRAIKPVLLGTDGGLHRTSNGGATWTFTGGGVNGYNALQITEVKGQWIDGIGRYDLYFGTQDNNNFGSTDMGVTWPNAICCEGFFFEMQKRVAAAADTQVTFVACGARPIWPGASCNQRSGPALTGTVGWSDPAGAVAGNPAIVDHSFHTQGVNNDAGFSAGFAVTLDLGTTWSQYATFPEQRNDLPKLSRRSFLGRFPVQYQSIRTGFDAMRGLEINHLVRLSKSFGAWTASVYYPAMNGFGGIGINPTMFAWYQVFGVDPQDSRYIIAPDVINEKMMQTSDGGDNWTEIPALTTLVTDGGRFQFRNSIFPHASAVSYYAGDPNMVAVGTHENGILISSDHGTTWTRVPGSERATYITWLEWRNATDVIVSTYGRGLWRLRGISWIQDFEPLCSIVNCLIRWIDRGDPPPDVIDPGIVIFEGRAQGVRVDRGRVTELFVTPGSSVGFVAKPDAAPQIKVTESRRLLGLQGSVRGLKAWPRGEAKVVALALDRAQGLRGFALSHSTLPTSVPTGAAEEKTEEPEPRSVSPTAAKPYVNLVLPGGDIERLVMGGRFNVVGRRFTPGAALEILVDRDVAAKVTVSDDGSFTATISAPQATGVHTLTVRDAASQRVIDGAQFKVNRGQERKDTGQRGGKAGREVVHGQHEEDERAGERLNVKLPVRGR